MKQVNFSAPEELIARLARESRESGVPRAEILRRALNAWLKTKEEAKCPS